MTIVPTRTSDDAFAFNIDLRNEIIIQNVSFACNLDDITVQLPRMHCKSEAYQNGAEIWIIFCRLKCPITPFRIEVGPSKLVIKELTLSFISLIFFCKEICSSFSTQSQ